MTDGWIKLWRKSLDSGLLQNPDLWTFWCWCLLKASHKPTRQLVGWQMVELEPGQFIFGRKAASKELPLSEQTIRTCLKKLKNLENLTIKTTNKFTIITINNWDTYQQQEIENNQQINQHLTSSQPAANHKQECKNGRREEEETLLSASNFSSSNGIPVKEISETWNDYIEKNCSVLPQIARINKKSQRYRHIHARWKEYPDLEIWQTVLNKATKSDFLNGRVKKFQASFDWVVKSTDNFSKVLEGNYDNKGESASGMTLEEFKEEFNMEIKTREELEEYIQKGNIRSDQRRRFKE